jgi:hypothetical protein
MNERIRQLADEAGLKYHNWITNESNINDGYFKYPRLEDYEKFAELIVKECMRMCEVAQVGYLTHGLEKEASGAFSVKQYIEEYLGVDE